MNRGALLRTRSSGILLHPSSLPGPHGAGDLGSAAYEFADFLAHAGQSWWQMLPVGPLGGGNSPYDSPSSFAGNPLFISLERLAHDGLLGRDDLAAPRALCTVKSADYVGSIGFRAERLRRAYARFRERSSQRERQQVERFVAANSEWLPDYALYTALKKAERGKPWVSWAPELVARKSAALNRAKKELQEEIDYQQFLQFLFERQWCSLREYCQKLGISLIGDIPMYVKYDGADVWANQRLFDLDARGRPRVLAGVPPDYFSKDGQLWGNPLYRWSELERTRFSWWIARLGKALERFDAVRLDHFIALYRCWQVPAGATTAKKGRFCYVPGASLLETADKTLGGLPFIAEDLGTVTPEVHALRDRFALPGMRVLAFAFNEPVSEYQPHRFTPNSVVYTGTHDNDTVVGWMNQRGPAAQPRALREQRKRFLRYAASDGKAPHWDMIRLALMSVANLAVVPMQDLLGLGSEARMNTPGTPHGNWSWRVSDKALSPALAAKTAELADTYERIPSRVRVDGGSGRSRSEASE
jgi:4-alpha-glucanotransferase